MSLQKIGREKKRRLMTIEMKKEVIEKFESGMRVVELARQYDRTTSTICTILKKKDEIKSSITAKGVTKLSKQRTPVHEEMEKILIFWINQKQLAGDSITETIICEKALTLHRDLSIQNPDTSSPEDTFKASRGWFEKFKNRTGIHSVVRHGEAASCNLEAAESFIGEFTKLIASEGYSARQIFNCDETGLFWKKMPRRTYITIEQKTMPGQKPMKDRLTLALCANASGELKIKPLLVYHSENPRAFKTHKIQKEKLKVMWRSNCKAWVTRDLFVEWTNLVFGPAVKKYLLENDLPLKALLVLDNAPAHPPTLEDDILEEFKFIKVLFLPPNTTPILQPMDQQVIANFKKLYTKHLFRQCFDITENTNLTLHEFWKGHYNIVNCLKNIDMAWEEVTVKTLNSAWSKLWPDCIPTGDSAETHMPEEEILFLANNMGLEVDTEDIDDLVDENTEELTTEDLLQLQERDVSVEKEECIVREKEIPTNAIKELLTKWQDISQFIERTHPENASTHRAISLFDDTALKYYRNILRGRKRQTTMDGFLMNSESSTSACKKSKTNEL